MASKQVSIAATTKYCAIRGCMIFNGRWIEEDSRREPEGQNWLSVHKRYNETYTTKESWYTRVNKRHPPWSKVNLFSPMGYWTSGKVIALSRRRRGFDSPIPYQCANMDFPIKLSPAALCGYVTERVESAIPKKAK